MGRFVLAKRALRRPECAAMNFARPFAVVLLVLTVAACKTAAEPAPKPADTGSSTSAASAAPAQAPESGLPKEGVYLLRSTGLRCVAAPCPYYEAKDVAAPADAAPTQVHALELSALELSDKARTKLEEQLTKGGVRAFGRFELQEKAGPAGDAVVFWVKELRE